MTAAVRDIDFVRGNSYEHEISFVDDSVPPLPLFWSDMTFAAQIRRFPDDAPFVSFTIDDSGLGAGLLVLTLTKAQTATLEGGYVWDLLVTDSNDLDTTLMGGSVIVGSRVTVGTP